MSYTKITSATVLTAAADATALNNSPIVIECDSTSAAFAVTLPVISTFTYPYGISYIFHDLGGVAATNPITITAGSGNEINNAATVLLNQNDQTVTVSASGPTDWTATYSNAGLPVVSATATAAGLTTGTIVNGNVFVNVTSASADDIIILPAPIPGTIVKLLNGATGYELRSNSPTTVGINGGTGADAESAIGASTYIVMECISPTNWIGSSYTAAGVKGVVQVAA